VTKRSEARRAMRATRFALIGVQVLAFLVFGAGRSLCAQTIEIKLVDGRNGRPMARSHVNVWVGYERKDAIVIPTDTNGVATLCLSRAGEEIDVRGYGNNCGGSGPANSVVKYQDSLRINVGYVLCQVRKADFSWLAINNFSTEEVLRNGAVSANTCGKAELSPKPGTVVIFVRPLTFWEKMKT
jgi:hypothetical protein